MENRRFVKKKMARKNFGLGKFDFYAEECFVGSRDGGGGGGSSSLQCSLLWGWCRHPCTSCSQVQANGAPIPDTSQTPLVPVKKQGD